MTVLKATDLTCLEFLSLKGGCIGSSESTLVKMPHCWKSYVAAQPDLFAILAKTLTKVSKCFLRMELAFFDFV